MHEQAPPMRRGRKRALADTTPRRTVNYRQLRNPLTPQNVFSQDEVAELHATSLRVLRELGIKVLFP